MHQHVSDFGFTPSDLVRLGAKLTLGVTPADLSARTMETPIYSGRLLAHEVQVGLTATANDITYLTDQDFTVDVEPSLICGLLIEGGDEGAEIGNHGHFARSLERPVLIGFRETKRYRRTCVRAQHCKAAGFILKPSFFERFGNDVADDGLAVLRDFASADFRAATLPRSNKLLEIARRILDHPYNGPLGELFLESCTLAMVVETAEHLKEERRLVSLIGRRHYDRVVEARDIIDANLIETPTSLQLARRVGVSVTTLQANFKAVFGTTIFGYVRNQRLMMARVLLHEHGLTAAEAGYKVGFSSPAAFTAAFRRRFGHPPGREAARSPS